MGFPRGLLHSIEEDSATLGHLFLTDQSDRLVEVRSGYFKAFHHPRLAPLARDFIENNAGLDYDRICALQQRRGSLEISTAVLKDF